MELLFTRLEGRGGHEAAYELLARLVGAPLPELRRTDRGKPYFPEGNPHFSVSHTPNHAFCCVHTEPIGIDAEEMDRKADLRVADYILSPPEKERLRLSSDPRDALLRLWVLKEAYAKYTGRGLGNYLKETDFSPDDPRIQIIDGCYVAIFTEGELPCSLIPTRI